VSHGQGHGQILEKQKRVDEAEQKAVLARLWSDGTIVQVRIVYPKTRIVRRSSQLYITASKSWMCTQVPDP